MLLGVVVYGFATAIFGVSRWFPLSLAMLALLGTGDMVSVFIRNSLVQLNTPDEMRGRSFQSITYPEDYSIGADVMRNLSVGSSRHVYLTILIGILLIPLACVLTPIFLVGMAIAPIYGVWGAIQTSQGHDFEYWWVGSWFRGILTGA